MRIAHRQRDERVDVVLSTPKLLSVWSRPATPRFCGIDPPYGGPFSFGNGQQGQKSWQFPLGHGRACPGHPDNRALRHPDRDRRDKSGDDATSFAPVTALARGAKVVA